MCHEHPLNTPPSADGATFPITTPFSIEVRSTFSNCTGRTIFRRGLLSRRNTAECADARVEVRERRADDDRRGALDKAAFTWAGSATPPSRMANAPVAAASRSTSSAGNAWRGSLPYNRRAWCRRYRRRRRPRHGHRLRRAVGHGQRPASVDRRNEGRDVVAPGRSGGRIEGDDLGARAGDRRDFVFRRRDVGVEARIDPLMSPTIGTSTARRTAEIRETPSMRTPRRRWRPRSARGGRPFRACSAPIAPQAGSRRSGRAAVRASRRRPGDPAASKARNAAPTAGSNAGATTRQGRRRFEPARGRHPQLDVIHRAADEGHRYGRHVGVAELLDDELGEPARAPPHRQQ